MLQFLTDRLTLSLKKIQGKATFSESNLEEVLQELKQSLLEADVHFKVVKDFLIQVKEKSLGQKVLLKVDPAQHFIKIVHDELVQLLGGEAQELKLINGKTNAILLLGPNGAGKTTLAAKLAFHFKKQNKKILLVSADTFRPAAYEQLKKLAQDHGLILFDRGAETDAVQVVKKGWDFAQKENYDLVIFDTAGRLHNNEELLQQMKEIHASLEHPYTLLTLDALTGQSSLEMAKVFSQNLPLSGVIFSKMDSDAKGGALLSLRFVCSAPVVFLSSGEKIQDLERFYPERMAQRILDKGDVVTLVEKAQDLVDEKEAQSMFARLEKKQFTFSDFLKQMEMFSKLGSIESVLGFLPGMSALKSKMGDMSQAQDEMKKMKVIISSMTLKEREQDKLLDQASRQMRVAKGSGRSVQEVQALLSRFRQMQKTMGGLFSAMKGGNPNFNLPQEKKGNSGNPWGKRYFKR